MDMETELHYFGHGPQKTKHGKFWMVTGVGNQPRVRHPTRAIATKEANRLASENPGVEFFVLEAVESFERPLGVKHRIL